MAPKDSQSTGNDSHNKKRKQPPENKSSQNTSGRDTPTGRDVKRAKFYDARQIHTQPPEAGLSASGDLDLQAFLNAREFEINALEGSMRRVKSSKARRAFQQVPRDMRRRTASHNVKRLPKRLRQRAAKEMKDDNTPHVEARTRRPRTTKARIRAETAKKLELLAKRKRGRKLKDAEEKRAKEAADAANGATPMDVDKPVKEKVLVQTRPARPKIRTNEMNEKPLESSKYKKRQKKAHWLPTHIWHAKRAKIETMWHFKIPTTPTAKSYRATHRAVHEKGAVCWDSSYYSTIRAYGKYTDLRQLIYFANADAPEAQAGSRKVNGSYAYRVSGSQAHPAGSVQIIFNPPNPSVDDPNRDRTLICRLHPLMFPDVWRNWRRMIRENQWRIKLEDLRWEIGSIDVTGPAATEALLGVLRPFPGKNGAIPPHARIFETLGPAMAPSVLPPSALISFDIKDPRLHYPPRTYQDADEDLTPSGVNMARMRLLADWPADEEISQSGLFDKDARYNASCLPSQKSINRRRGERPPGTPLPLMPADPPIPIILTASRGQIEGGHQGTWTLLAPWKCILPLWHSLLHYPLSAGGNPRFGCLDQAKQVKFEQGLPWFPRDFPASPFGLKVEIEDRIESHRKAAQLPKDAYPLSRIDLGAGRKGEDFYPFGCDWEALFGWDMLKYVHCSVDPEDWEGDDPPADAKITQLKVPFLRDDGLSWPAWVAEHPLMSSMTSLPTGLVLKIFNAKSRDADALTNCENALIAVRVTMIGRGVPTSQARVYRLPRAVQNKPSSKDAEIPSTNPATQLLRDGMLPTDLREQWLALLPQSKSKQAAQAKRNTKPQKKQNNKDTQNKPQQPRRMPPDVSVEARKSLLAASLLSSELPYPRPPRDTTKDMDGHPLVPGKKDLIGFITTGGFNLALGRGMGIGHVKAAMVAEDMWRVHKGVKNNLEPRLCIVRNKGEGVGWLARWDVIDTRNI